LKEIAAGFRHRPFRGRQVPSPLCLADAAASWLDRWRTSIHWLRPNAAV